MLSVYFHGEKLRTFSYQFHRRIIKLIIHVEMVGCDESSGLEGVPIQDISFVLYPDIAPMAVENFVGLAQQGYYNGLTVSRVESGFVVEAGQGTDGKGTTIWSGSRYPAETTDSLHHYSGALCMGVDASGECASVFYVVQTLPGDQSVTQELVDKMNASGYRAEVVAAYQTVGGAPYLDYTDTVFGQVYEGMDVVDTIGQTGVDENQKPTEDITINSVSIETYQ